MECVRNSGHSKKEVNSREPLFIKCESFKTLCYNSSLKINIFVTVALSNERQVHLCRIGSYLSEV